MGVLCGTYSLGIAIPVKNGEEIVVQFLRGLFDTKFVAKFKSVTISVVDDASNDETLMGLRRLHDLAATEPKVKFMLDNNPRCLGQHKNLLSACKKLPRGLDFYATMPGDGDEGLDSILNLIESLTMEQNATAEIGLALIEQDHKLNSSIKNRFFETLAWRIFSSNYSTLPKGESQALTKVFRGPIWDSFIDHFEVFGYPSLAVGEMDVPVVSEKIIRSSNRPSNYTTLSKLGLLVRISLMNSNFVSKIGLWMAVFGFVVSVGLVTYNAVLAVLSSDLPEGWLTLSMTLAGLSSSVFASFGLNFFLLSRLESNQRRQTLLQLKQGRIGSYRP